MCTHCRARGLWNSRSGAFSKAPGWSGRIDAIVLGCTHYPFFRPQIRKIVGPDIPVIDGSEGTARELHRQLGKRGWLQQETRPGSITFENSDPSKIPLMEQMMKINID